MNNNKEYLSYEKLQNTRNYAGWHLLEFDGEYFAVKGRTGVDVYRKERQKAHG